MYNPNLYTQYKEQIERKNLGSVSNIELSKNNETISFIVNDTIKVAYSEDNRSKGRLFNVLVEFYKNGELKVLEFHETTDPRYINVKNLFTMINA